MDAVTVIIPTYNRAGRIESTISSVLDQDYGKVEIIVVDDGSTDSTESIVRGLADKSADSNKQIRYVKQPNQGACVARNHGMMLATGRYIMFLDSDDLIKKSMLSIQVSKIESENTQCSICDFETVDESGMVLNYYNNNRHPHDFIRNLISPHISSLLMRRDSIPPGLVWNPKLLRTQDIDFIYKYFASIESYSYVNEALFHYCLHGDERISDGYIKGLQYRVLRESFRSYVNNNDLFPIYPKQVCNAYMYALWRHQIKNFIAKHTPLRAKLVIKKLHPYIKLYIT
ncbi:glycosyltransferase family 2 protein [Methylococcus capsulatus]|uniref:glycosyltransferase family 2 protein n=1 Tax=Methylococcus capsulatus TaxID=414 RepID=UPI0009D9DC3A